VALSLSPEVPVERAAERAVTPSRAPARPRNVTRLGPGRPIPCGRLLGPAALLAMWTVLSLTHVLDARLIPPPWSVARTAAGLIANGTLQANLIASLARAGSGLLFGVIAGTTLAAIAGLSVFGDALIDGPVQIKRAIPALGLIPLMILWFGIGETMKVIVIALSVLVPVYINTHAALGGIDKRYVDLAETLRLSRWTFIRRIIIPGALPGFFTGLRLAVTAAWVGLVVVEQINAESGLGYMMVQADQYGQTGVIFVALAVYGLFGWLADALVRALERRSLVWRRTLAR
jgi:sulfonate transport system permease protein